jgi:hypothetical protein
VLRNPKVRLSAILNRFVNSLHCSSVPFLLMVLPEHPLPLLLFPSPLLASPVQATHHSVFSLFFLFFFLLFHKSEIEWLGIAALLSGLLYGGLMIYSVILLRIPVVPDPGASSRRSHFESNFNGDYQQVSREEYQDQDQDQDLKEHVHRHQQLVDLNQDRTSGEGERRETLLE